MQNQMPHKNPLVGRVKPVGILAALLAFSSVASAQLTVNFNANSATLTDGFTFTNTSGGNPIIPTWNASSGIGGTGGVNITAGAGSGAVMVNNTALSVSSSTFTTSVFLRTGTIPTSPANFWNGAGFAHIGFADRVAGTNTQVADAASEFFAVRLQAASTTGGNVFQFATRSDTAAAGGATANVGTSFTLEANTWYQLSASFTKGVSAGAWTYTASLTSFGGDGLTAGTVAASTSGSFTQTALYNASQVYGLAHIRRQGDWLSFTNVDNYVAAVPEPSSFAAFAGLGALGVVGMRRRRRA